MSLPITVKSIKKFEREIQIQFSDFEFPCKIQAH